MGRILLSSANGKERDERLIRMNFNTAKVIDRVRFGREFVFYQSMERWLYVEYKEIVWAYRRLEDVEGKLGVLRKRRELHTIMVVTREGKRIGIAIEGEENAAAGLKLLEEKNPLMDIGFTKEKERRYLAGLVSYF